MLTIDWIVVGIYSLASLILGIVLTKKASSGVESYFASDRNLSWWLAGTSMAATAFSSDTPLLVTGIVRQRGIWGNWEVWALGISTMLAVFFFSKLWKRAGVLTEVEFVELRYSGKSAAFLRGFKAIYWGIFYNAFIMGAWPMTGLAKVMQETTDWSKTQSILFCVGLTALYSTLSGFWGVILTDFLQFIVAMGGAILLAFYAVDAAGGLHKIVEVLEPTGKLSFIPPAHGDNFSQLLASPFGWFLSLVLIQWWAWKNTDGGGIIVQRIASCKNEKHAVYATLWFNIAQYALRSWPWIITALASLLIFPNLTDHESAYPKLIATLLPPGLRGLMIASFFAAFMSTMSTHLNWGSSYFVSDFYKRFVKKNSTEHHYVRVAQITSFTLAIAATIISFFTDSIGKVFTLILNLTAAIGPVYFLRWFWWRINSTSEMAAMAVSFPVLLFRPIFFKWLGIDQNPLFDLVFMIIASAAIWVPATFLTSPVPDTILKNFYTKVNPPGFWNHSGLKEFHWNKELELWLISTIALALLTAGPLYLLLQKWMVGFVMTGVSIICWFILAHRIKQNFNVTDNQSRL